MTSTDPSTATRAVGTRVIVVSPGFAPQTGGVEQHVGRLVTGLVARGVTVEVLTARRGIRRMLVEQRDGFSVRVYPAWRMSAMSMSPRLLWAAARAGTDGALVHVHSYHAICGLAAAVGGRDIVFTPHYHGVGHSAPARLIHRGYRLLGSRMMRTPRAVICVSEAEKARLVADHPSAAAHAVVIPNGIDRDRLAAAEPFADQPPTAVVLGRLEPYKGVDRIVRAFAEVPAPAQLVILGAGSQRSAISELVTATGLSDRVVVAGFRSDAEVARWLRTAAVLVSASEQEAFGIVPLEAAGAGARVVLSDIPAHREIVADFLGETATIVTGHDTSRWAAAIAAALAEPASGAVAPELPDWSEVVDQTLAVYDGSRPGPVALTPAPRPGRPVGNRSTRVGALDQSWDGHWSVIAVTPVAPAPLETVRARLLEHLLAHPESSLAHTLGAGSRRWTPVPPAELADHVAQMVIVGDRIETESIGQAALRRRPPTHGLPLRVLIGPDSVCAYFAHANGDASMFLPIVRAVALGDFSAIDNAPRAGVKHVVAAARGQFSDHYRDWWAFGRGRDTDPGEGAGAGAAVTEAEWIAAGPASPACESIVLTNAHLRDYTRWRNENHRGVSITAVLTSATYRALRAAGVPVDGTAFYSLFDVRQYLPDALAVTGNLAKSLGLRADLADCVDVDRAMTAAMTTARVVPALLIGALTRTVRPVEHRDDSSSGPLSLTFNSLPNMPGLSDLPWTTETGRRYVGVGYPTGRRGISVFALRLRDRMEVSISFDDGAVDPAAVRQALSALESPAELMA